MASGVTIGTIDGQVITALSVNIGTASTVPIVAAVAGQRVRLYKLLVSSAAAQSITFSDGTTALSGAIPVATAAPFVLPMDGQPWYTSSTGNALNIVQTSAVALTGSVWFTQSTS